MKVNQNKTKVCFLVCVSAFCRALSSYVVLFNWTDAVSVPFIPSHRRFLSFTRCCEYFSFSFLLHSRHSMHIQHVVTNQHMRLCVFVCVVVGGVYDGAL